MEGAGCSYFWIDDTGYSEATDVFTTHPHLVATHKGEAGNDVTGWGIGDNQIRPAIAILGGTLIQTGKFTLKENYFAFNFVRNRIGATYSNDISVGGPDAVFTIGANCSFIEGNCVPKAHLHTSHYGEDVAPKYYLHFDNSLYGASSENQLFINANVYDIPHIYKGTSWLKTRAKVIVQEVNYKYFGASLLENPNYQNAYNRVYNAYTAWYNKNIYEVAQVVKIDKGVLSFVPQLNSSGSSNWYAVSIPSDSMPQLSFVYVGLLNSEQSQLGIQCVLKKGSTAISNISITIPSQSYGVACFVVDKEDFGTGVNVIFEVRINNKQVFATMPFIHPVEGEINRQQFGENCDEKGMLIRGTTAQRPPIAFAPIGQQYFDETLGKMIVSNGTAWVNMDGTAL